MSNKKITKVIALGCDHAGFEYKNDISSFLKIRGYEIADCGTHSSDSVDYPVIADATCKLVQEGAAEIAILICGTGIGMSIAANKHSDIRAALCWNEECASLARRHNDANVLCIGARMIDFETIKSIISVFLNTDFEGGRHQRRVDQLNSLDK